MGNAPNLRRARYEHALSMAHRALWRAHSAAAELEWEVETAELWSCLGMLTALGEHALKGAQRPRKVLDAGQLSIDEVLSQLEGAGAVSPPLPRGRRKGR
jgi:hypothetical protein